MSKRETAEEILCSNNEDKFLFPQHIQTILEIIHISNLKFELHIKNWSESLDCHKILFCG
jgi:hypothetical protein